ncbi:hypothetical protein [Pedobacter sp. MW01-1-1]|uniref:hypothetical protein n=1 Tax=Pedobacter sp. MW01-1-1 TaxID=3383027 RepID=UPI003FEE7372
MVETAINGEIFSWSNIRLFLLGRSVVGLKAIDYKDGVEVKGVKGRGMKDIGFVRGNYNASGKVTFEMAEVEALNASMPAGTSIYDLSPFDITVCYRNNSNRLVTHVLKNCLFTEQSRSGKAGEVKEFEVELPIYIGEINWNA